MPDTVDPENAGKPLIGLTLGDAAGIGPELIVRACLDERVRECCRPVVFGHSGIIRRAAALCGLDLAADSIPCNDVCQVSVLDVRPGTVDPRAGRAAHDALIAAGEAALGGEIDAVVTAPLNKAALNRAGFHIPGHTEILAKLCGVQRFAMLLHLPSGDEIESPHGLSVAHVTLHTSIASVPGLLSIKGIREKIELVDGFLRDIGCERPRIAVCALNPHAGEEGLFGDEERTLIAPAVEAARQSKIDVAGPFPADTLMLRAVRGEFDGLVAMYHDQGHIPFKLLGFDAAVNVTLGLPIVRTSPSQGTAFDIAWQGVARPEGMIAAIRVAALLAPQKKRGQSVPSAATRSVH